MTLEQIESKVRKSLEKASLLDTTKYANLPLKKYHHRESLVKWYRKNYKGQFLKIVCLDEFDNIFGKKYQVIMGDYGFTPIGIHNDPHILVTHILLHGRKEMMFYDDYDIRMLYTHPNKHEPSHVDYLKKGDIYQMEGDVYHVGFSDNISIDIIICDEIN